jgi:SAM-dependent methyltransferase
VPGSRYEQIEVIVDLMVRLEPRSVLDVGIGNGLYGLLIRQYVDGSGPFDGGRAEARTRLDGIEIFEGYLTGVQRTVYDDIRVGDALEILPGVPSGEYDLALALDVIEHLPDPKGGDLLRQLRRVARHVIVTSPRGEFPQGALFGNEHETHVSTWPPERLRKASAAVIVPHPFISIALFTDDQRFARYYRRYLRLRRLSVLAPAWLVARMVNVGPLREFALRRAPGGLPKGGTGAGPS